MKSVIIPIFISHLGCPFQCVFCNQEKISGERNSNVTETIDTHLKTIQKVASTHVEVAFYGGSFTAIPFLEQKKLLEQVNPYIVSGHVDSIRVSTRPDFIDSEIIAQLKEFVVRTVELGIQSLDDYVLERSGRGYQAAIVDQAAEQIKNAGLALGFQLMPGLPGDTLERMEKTTRKTLELKPDFVRIYPTLVVTETPLHRMYLDGAYQPLSLEDAIHCSASMVLSFARAGIKIIRLGLQATDLLEKEHWVAGPYHPAFGELVYNEVAFRIIDDKIKNMRKKTAAIQICIPHKKMSKFIGQQRKNLLRFQRKYGAGFTMISSTTLPDHHYGITNAQACYVFSQGIV